MNNQQAINLLKGLEKNLDDYCELNDEGKTAFGMAITALELFGNSEQLPSAQPEQRWIPVSERLPDDLAEVNVTWINHKPEPYYDFTKDKPFTASAVYYKGGWYWYSSVCADLLAEYGKNEIDEIDDAIEITAWMPWPEPARLEND